MFSVFRFLFLESIYCCSDLQYSNSISLQSTSSDKAGKAGVSQARQPQLPISAPQFTAEKLRWGWYKRHGTSVGPRLILLILSLVVGANSHCYYIKVLWLSYHLACHTLPHCLNTSTIIVQLTFRLNILRFVFLSGRRSSLHAVIGPLISNSTRHTLFDNRLL